MDLKTHINRTWLLSLPLIGGQLAQIAINATDTIMLGWDGTLSLASGVLGTQAIFFFFILGSGFAHAVVPIAGSASAQGDTRALRRAVRMGLWLTGLMALASMPILWFFEDVLLFLGQDPQVSAMASSYIRVALWGMAPALWVLVFRSFFATLERAQIIFWAIIPAILINILLNYTLIFGNFGAPALGVVGAAWASVITNLVIFFVMLSWLYLRQEYREYDLLGRLWRSDWAVFWRVASLGLPISISIIAEISMFLGSSILMGWMGTIELAAHGIALQLGAIAFMIPLGIANAATVRVSNGYGRKDMTDIKSATHAALVVAMLFAVLTATIFFVLPDELVVLFLDQERPDALTVALVAAPLVIIAGAFQVVDSWQAIAAGVLRGFQDVTIPMIIAIISYGPLGLLAAYIFGFTFGLGGIGVWLGLTLGLAFTSVFLTIRYFMQIKKIEAKL